MRWWVWCLTLLAASPSSAFVVMDPPIVAQCATQKTWTTIAVCLRKHGTVTSVRAEPGLKLVRVVQPLPGAKPRDLGLYLFLERAGAWRLAGMFRDGGDEYAVLAFDRLTIGNHTGYRLRIGQAHATWVTLDGVTRVAATMRRARTVFCSGQHFYCTDATTACEVLVRGRAHFVFHGRLEIDGNVIHVHGDRSKAGPCAVPHRVLHGWPISK